MEENRKIKRLAVKFTDREIGKVKGSDKRVYLKDVCPGLYLEVRELKINADGEDVTPKAWYLQYRPKGKAPTKLKIGDATGPAGISRTAAVIRLTGLLEKIKNGADPYFEKIKLREELTLGALVKKFYSERLNQGHGYKPKTIKHVKDSLRVWVFEETQDAACKAALTYSIKDMQISRFTNQKMRQVHSAIRIKSPYAANRIVAYLKVIFNFALELKLVKNNPCKIKKKHLAPEAEANDVLTETQYWNVFNTLFVVDARTGRLNINYYQKFKLNLISCLAIAFCLITGRRQISEGLSLTWAQIKLDLKVVNYTDSKVGPKSYKLSDIAVGLLKAMQKSLMNRDYIVDPVKSDYVFPSDKNATELHIQSVRATWSKVLEMCNVKYIAFKQCRHSFATVVLRKCKNVKVVQELLGHTKLSTTMRYVKIVGEDVEEALDLMTNPKDKNSDKDNIVEFKK